MLKPIEAGCRAIIIKPSIPENYGREVTVVRKIIADEKVERDGIVFKRRAGTWLCESDEMMPVGLDGKIAPSKTCCNDEHKLLRIDGGEFEEELIIN